MKENNEWVKQDFPYKLKWYNFYNKNCKIDRFSRATNCYHLKMFPSLEQAKCFLTKVSLLLMEVLVNENITLDNSICDQNVATFLLLHFIVKP